MRLGFVLGSNTSCGTEAGRERGAIFCSGRPPHAASARGGSVNRWGFELPLGTLWPARGRGGAWRACSRRRAGGPMVLHSVSQKTSLRPLRRTCQGLVRGPAGKRCGQVGKPGGAAAASSASSGGTPLAPMRAPGRTPESQTVSQARWAGQISSLLGVLGSSV